MTNPLLDFSGLPKYAEISAAHVGPAITQLLAEARQAVQRVEQAAPTWDAFVEPLDDANERLGRAWGAVGHLQALLVVLGRAALLDEFGTAGNVHQISGNLAGLGLVAGESEDGKNNHYTQSSDPQLHSRFSSL